MSPWSLDGRRLAACRGRAVRALAAVGARGGARTCCPAATPATTSPSCARASPGTGSRVPGRPSGRAAAGRHQRRHHPGPRMFGVFLSATRARRVGELDEEMVYESRVGDVFLLGSAAWRIEDITHDRRPRHAPRPGSRAAAVLARRRPRPAGRARAGRRAFVREIAGSTSGRGGPGPGRRARRLGAATTCWGTCAEQSRPHRPAARRPDDVGRTVPRQLCDWRVRVCPPPSAGRCTPRGRSLCAGSASGSGSTSRPARDDGLVLRLPDVRDRPTAVPSDVARPRHPRRRRRGASSRRAGGSARFAPGSASALRAPCCCPRRTPGKRQPLWQQRQRAAQLLQVASRFGSFPIVLETMRECLQDVFDVPGWCS
jgi:ATP-dependent Lhr-like helicase